MNRTAITLIVTLILGILLAPVAAEAQRPTKVPRIGVLVPGPLPPRSLGFTGFQQGLRELGYVEGQNIIIEWRFAEGESERARELAVELVQLPVDVLVAGGPDGPLAATHATSTIPIVIVFARDPVAMGLVASLARPGGNVTGVTYLNDPAFYRKLLQLLVEAVPGATRIAALRHRPATGLEPVAAANLQAVEKAAQSLGVHLQVLEIGAPDELEGAFAAVRGGGAQALFQFHSPFFTTHRSRIVELAAQHRLAGIYAFRSFMEAGGLMSYNASLGDQWRRAAYYVDRILKGAKPADLPVEQPMTFEFVINLKTAKALGLTIPPSILIQATEVIQ